MLRNNAFIVVVFTVATLLLSGCADRVAVHDVGTHTLDGFWFGVWHGAILPIAWLNSLFDPDVAIYAVNNNGTWYDTGYLVGVGSLVLAAVSLNSFKYRH